jgi:hypothetical protein
MTDGLSGLNSRAHDPERTLAGQRVSTAPAAAPLPGCRGLGARAPKSSGQGPFSWVPGPASRDEPRATAPLPARAGPEQARPDARRYVAVLTQREVLSPAACRDGGG